MKIITRSALVALWLALSGTLAVTTASAHEQWAEGEHHHHEFSPQEHEAWIKKRFDHEAGMLEISASQQGAWETYVAAKLDLINTFHDMRKEHRAHEGADAAAMARMHADHAMKVAQKLSALADATDKLQAALNDNQKKVLNRLACHEHPHHGFGHRDNEHGMHHGMDGSKDAAKSAAKAPATKPKQPQQ